MSLRSRIIAHTDGNKVFWMMISAIVFMSLFYIYAVNSTVVSVAERDSIESKISATKAELASLESKYISGKSAITMELASSLGYSEAKKIVYVSKKSVSVLSRADRVQ